MDPEAFPYCGAPPTPDLLMARWNLDPWLLAGLALLALSHLACRPGSRLSAVAGWAVATLALVSPLCALSVSLFAARVGQHMILTLVAAPLLALGLPSALRYGASRLLWPGVAFFFITLWFWHMPAPYQASFRSTAIYWLMHGSLFGGAVLLWAALLHQPAHGALKALAAGMASSMQMGFLGAVLTLAGRPLFAVHLATTRPWGLDPLADQQLGGLIMWIPGTLIFIAAATWSLTLLWRHLATGGDMSASRVH